MKKKILIIDDEILIAEILSKIIKSLNYETHICNDGKEAVEYFKKHHKEISLVILDMIMSEMNGKETFLILQKIDPNVKVLIVSGYSLEEDARELLEKGAINFIEKPFRSKDIINEINKALSR